MWSIYFLVHIVGKTGTHVDDTKIAVINDLEDPSIVKDIYHF